MENENNKVSDINEESGLSLKDLFLIIRKHIIAIFVFVICFSVCGFTLATYKDNKSPRYTTSATMLVGRPSITDDKGNEIYSETTKYQLANYLVPTFMEIFYLDKILEPVSTEYHVSVGTLKSNLSVYNTESSNNYTSLFITLKYTASSAKLSADILNAIANKTVEYTTSDYIKDNNSLLHKGIMLVDEATESKASQSSSKKKYLLVFFVLGVVVAGAYVALREILDNSFKSSEQVEQELGLRVIASIPLYQFDINDENNKGVSK